MPAKISNPNGPHHSQENFLRFLPHLEQLCSQFPAPVTFHPDGLAPSTFAGRFRDAGRAFLIHKFRSPLDYDTFLKVWEGTVVRIVGNVVVVSPPKAEVDTIAVAERPATYLFTLTSPNHAQLEAAIRVIESGISTLPILIEGAIPDVTLPPTVILQPKSDGTHILI